jgi:hypothetical protein
MPGYFDPGFDTLALRADRAVRGAQNRLHYTLRRFSIELASSKRRALPLLVDSTLTSPYLISRWRWAQISSSTRRPNSVRARTVTGGINAVRAARVSRPGAQPGLADPPRRALR